MANNIKLRIEVIDEATGKIKVVEKELKGFGSSVEGASKQTTGLGGAFSGLVGKLTVGVGVATAAGAALKKAFELGREGAAIAQTDESFGLLLEKVGASPRLLDELNAAAGRTITELELMSATATLLAGAQGELATQLANSTPRLLEIARAAGKLNPTLGDTTFLYESLALGIKRASPLILDNLGLTIKIGEANEKYAEQLSKTVEQLTAEEQKIALLNATLEAGGVLIDQVGGDVESAVDPFKRLETTFDELGNQIKEGFVPAATAAADALDRIFSHGVQAGRTFREMKADIDAVEMSYEDYIDALLEAAVKSGILDRAWVNLNREALIAGQRNIVLTNTLGGVTRAQQASMVAAQGYEEALEDSNKRTEEAATNNQLLEDSLRAATGEYNEMLDIHKELSPEMRKFQDNVKIIGEVGTTYARALGMMGQATQDLSLTTGGFNDNLDDLIADLEDRASPQTLSYMLAVDSLVAAYKRGEINGQELLDLLKQLRDEMAAGTPVAETHAGVVATYGQAWADAATGVDNYLRELENLLVFLRNNPELMTALTQREFIESFNDDLGAGGDSPGGGSGGGPPDGGGGGAGTPPPGAGAPPPTPGPGPGGPPTAPTVTINATVSNGIEIEQLAHRVAEVIQRSRT